MAHPHPVATSAQAPAPVAPAPPGLWGDVDLVADRLLAIVGGGPILHVGCGAGEFVAALLHRGVDARGVDAEIPAGSPLGDRLCAAPLDELGGADGSVETVVVSRVLDEADDAGAAGALRQAHRLARRSVVLVIDLARGGAARRGREWWEGRALEAGFRKHPLCQSLVAYEALEGDGTGLWGRHLIIALEKVPAPALAEFPLSSLDAERGLHNDMLRATGRRADAHVARYALAARFVRPGDTVLDVACGLGYGAAVLSAGTEAARIIGVDNSPFAVRYAAACYTDAAEFREGDATDLSLLQDGSVDVVVSMETLEHLPDPEGFLREAARVLRPGGRIVASVPNDWTDESGRDPNPHHLHVYTWAKIREQISGRFHLETAFAQTAGGGMKLADRARRIREIGRAPADDGAGIEAEWWLAVGMKDPVGAPREGFRDTTYGDLPDPPSVVAFARDYDNPWLVKAMVSIGMRAGGALLTALTDEVLATARAGSADLGAALCVRIYRELERTPDPAHADELLARVAAYHERADDKPHAYRWRISNQFAAAMLLQRLGRRAEARAAFERCAAMDCLRFSPVLATKTVDACFHAGRLAACDGDLNAARAHWRRGVEEVRRVLAGHDWSSIWGDPDRPFTFAMPEIEQVADLARRCAAGLNMLPALRRRPGLAWKLLHANRAQEMTEFWREARRLAGEWEGLSVRSGTDVRRLNEELRAVARERDALREALERTDADHAARTRQLSEKAESLWSEAQTFLRERDAFRVEARRLAGEWEKQVARAVKAESALAEAAGERDGLRAEAQRLAAEWEKTAAQLRTNRSELEDLRTKHGTLGAESARVREDLRAAEAHNAALRAHLLRLEEAITRHETRAVTVVLRRAGLLRPIEAGNGHQK